MAEIYVYKSWDNKNFPNFLYFMKRAPFSIVIFINSFHLMNFSFLLAVIFKLLNYNSAFLFFSFLFFTFISRYIWLRLEQRTNRTSLYYLAINYLLNLSYSLGAFIGGLKDGMFYLEATVDEVR